MLGKCTLFELCPRTLDAARRKSPGRRHPLFRKGRGARPRIRRLIVDLIDKEEWSSLGADVKGDAYEGLLQKNAEDVKGGAGHRQRTTAFS